MERIEQRKTTTVVGIISSNYLLGLGLQRIVETEEWIRLIDPVPSGTNIDDMLSGERPDILIIDMEMEGNVAELIRKVKASPHRAKTILLSGFADRESARQTLDFGVDGIVLKVQPSAVLIATIEHLARPSGEIEEVATQRKVAKVPRAALPYSGNPCGAKWPEGLTEREREVIRLISQGLSNKDIANRLYISSITVRHHLTNIFDKLGVSNRQKLLIRAHQYGIVELTAQA